MHMLIYGGLAPVVNFDLFSPILLTIYGLKLYLAQNITLLGEGFFTYTDWENGRETFIFG